VPVVDVCSVWSVFYDPAFVSFAVFRHEIGFGSEFTETKTNRGGCLRLITIMIMLGLGMRFEFSVLYRNVEFGRV